jgi:hypothetical protein
MTCHFFSLMTQVSLTHDNGAQGWLKPVGFFISGATWVFADKDKLRSTLTSTVLNHGLRYLLTDIDMQGPASVKSSIEINSVWQRCQNGV